MVRIHQGALVTPTALSESRESFLFFVLKLVLKTQDQQPPFRLFLRPKFGSVLIAITQASTNSRSR